MVKKMTGEKPESVPFGVYGMWFTGIVAFGKEYYFGAGMCYDEPGKTPFGEPTK